MLQQFDEVVKNETDTFNQWLSYNQMYHLERYLGMRHLRSKEPGKIEKSLQARKLLVLNQEFTATALANISNQIAKIPVDSVFYERIHKDYSAMHDEAQRLIKEVA